MLPSGPLGHLPFLCYRHAVMTVIPSFWGSPWGDENLLEEGEPPPAGWGELPVAEAPSAVGGSAFPALRARSVLQHQDCLCLRKAPAWTEQSSGQACGERVLEVGFESLTEPVSPARAVCFSFWKKCHLTAYCAQTYHLRAWESLLKPLYLTRVVEPCRACIGAALACLVTQQDHAGYPLPHLCRTQTVPMIYMDVTGTPLMPQHPLLQGSRVTDCMSEEGGLAASTEQGWFDEVKEGLCWCPYMCCRQLMCQPPISTSPAQMACGKAHAVWFHLLLERVILSTHSWGWREEVTPTGDCFTAGSRSVTVLWICSTDTSFKQSSTNLLHLLTISLITHTALLLISLSHVLQHEVPNLLHPYMYVYKHICPTRQMPL